MQRVGSLTLSHRRSGAICWRAALAEAWFRRTALGDPLQLEQDQGQTRIGSIARWICSRSTNRRGKRKNLDVVWSTVCSSKTSLPKLASHRANAGMLITDSYVQRAGDWAHPPTPNRK
jgi:hypothetical protein